MGVVRGKGEGGFDQSKAPLASFSDDIVVLMIELAYL